MNPETLSSMCAVVFWVCAAAVAYAYIGYPLLLWVFARWLSRPVSRGPFAGTASFVLAAHNEAGRVGGKRDELLGLLDATDISGEVIIVSDGSADLTAAAARENADPRLHVIELAENVGKAEALTRGCVAAKGEVIVFADVRQRWAGDALQRLLENFADPSVGGVSGDLCLESSDGTVQGVGLYWKYEKAIRKLEGQLHSVAGATGAISAVRRNLFRPIPKGTILDDVYWPLQVVMQGFRIVHDDRAIAFDRLPEGPGDEFRRKVRTLSGNFQLVARCPSLLLPWGNPIWVQFVSHKLLRLAVPWLLIVMLIGSALAPRTEYRVCFLAQVAGYALAVAGLNTAVSRRIKPAAVAASFCVLNLAAFVAFWIWISGRSGQSWRKVRYDRQPVVAAAS